MNLLRLYVTQKSLQLPVFLRLRVMQKTLPLSFFFLILLVECVFRLSSNTF